MTRNPASRSKLYTFLSKAVAVAVSLASFVSALLAFWAAVPQLILLIIAVSLVAVCGWGAAFYLAASSRFVKSPIEDLTLNLGSIIGVPFIQPWLQSTVLNLSAVELYWKKNTQLRIEEIHCFSDINAQDAHLISTIKGRNASRGPADRCPFALFGGSLINYPDVSDNVAEVFNPDTNSWNRSNIEPKLELGQFHLVDIVLPRILDPGQNFQIRHTYSWPGAMVPGTDAIWYPYGAMFDRDVDKLTVDAKFDVAVTYVRGYVADLRDGTCKLTAAQPSSSDANGFTYTWTLEPVDNNVIYILVFDRP